jgi:phenylpyruvate tautomerase PptA (4-oxalocrotonate tautomerase family)
MPLWEIFAPEAALSPEDKKALANDIIKIYSLVNLPNFYVDVIYHDLPAHNIYAGGEATGNFVRVRIEHIAREIDENMIVEGLPVGTFTKEWLREWFMLQADAVLEPYVKARGFEWEVHVDETPVDLWTVQGFIPPPGNSESERLWKELNRPVRYDRIPPAPPTVVAD